MTVQRWMSLLLLTGYSQYALGCEGPCMVGVTKKFLQNYHDPVYAVFTAVAQQIETSLIPPHAHAELLLDYLSPLLSAYEQSSYATMEKSIFPSYFHGKCIDPATNSIPAGCPNPDCHVVCGTPGSLVHFYPTLRRIAFQNTRDQLSTLVDPDSDTYQKIERTVLKYANKPSSRSFAFPRKLGHRMQKETTDRLHTIVAALPGLVETACGGLSDSDNAVNDELPLCSWKEDTTDFILTFP